MRVFAVRDGAGHFLHRGLQLREEPLDLLPSDFTERFTKPILEVMSPRWCRRCFGKALDQQSGPFFQCVDQLGNDGGNFRICDCPNEAPGINLGIHEASFPAVLVS